MHERIAAVAKQHVAVAGVAGGILRADLPDRLPGAEVVPAGGQRHIGMQVHRGVGRQRLRVGRIVKPLADRQSYVQPVLVPMDWYLRLLEKVGDGWVSTYIKYLVWAALNKPKSPLTVPQRMQKFITS